MYLDFGNRESNQAVVEFTFDTTTSTSQRKFEISVSQIECTSIYKYMNQMINVLIRNDGISYNCC